MAPTASAIGQTLRQPGFVRRLFHLLVGSAVLIGTHLAEGLLELHHAILHVMVRALGSAQDHDVLAPRDACVPVTVEANTHHEAALKIAAVCHRDGLYHAAPISRDMGYTSPSGWLGLNLDSVNGANMDDRNAFLKELAEAFGPPGLEDDVATILRRETEGFCETSKDNIGSFIARKNGSADGPLLMFAGHMDEVGFMVTDIEPAGYLRFRALGGWWPHVLLGQRVTVRTRKGDFLGVVGSKPPHELDAEERKHVQKLEDLFIDLGVADGFDAVEATGVRRGDFVVPHAPFEPLVNPDLFVVKAWDNRVGCGLVVDLLKELRDIDHPNTVCGVATVQEEIGLRGAATSAAKVQPDLAIALDVGIARDTPGFSGADRAQEKLGGGAGILLLERGHVSHPRLTRFVIDVAEEEKIPYHTTTIMAGGTDANRFHIVGEGIPSLALCVPSRYIHSHSSIIDRRDYDATLQLLVALCKRLDTDAVNEIRGN